VRLAHLERFLSALRRRRREALEARVSNRA
jgi:hypothetical protein